MENKTTFYFDDEGQGRCSACDAELSWGNPIICPKCKSIIVWGKHNGNK